MSLHYTDTETNGRLAPSVDAQDVHINPLAHNTASISPRVKGTQTAAKVITKDSRIIGYDGSNNIGLFGFDDAGNMVVKVAKTGFDANSATNDQLIFNSQQDTFKIVASNTASKTLSGSHTKGELNTIVVPHGLTTTPAYLLYVNNPAVTGIGNGLQLAPASTYALFTVGSIQMYLPSVISFGTIDATNLTINIQFLVDYTLGSSYTWSFRYYILQETAN